ncbi:MAG: hypothetical protein EOQ47_11175 [Mesorhizobium sp.]|nr:MAG: hypothetical protein EOQ47_11175 [Mesorhizobium sp.]
MSEPGSIDIRASVSLNPDLGVLAQAVEGFFAKLTKRRLERGSSDSPVVLQAAIKHFLAETNDNPRPFIWSADPKKIIRQARAPSVRFDPLDIGAGTLRFAFRWRRHRFA